MTNKKGADDEDRKDLTRIEDLSEFLHEEDPEIEGRLSALNVDSHDNTDTDLTSGIALDELDDQELPPDLPETEEPAPIDPIEEGTVHSIEADDLGMELEEVPFTDFTEETSNVELEVSSFDALPDVAEFSDENNDLGPSFDEGPHSFEEDQVLPQHSSEKFEDVKNFAQNFSYGQIQGGGNPPYSIAIRNLVYEQDASDILDLLSEFGVVNDSNLNDTKMALEMGSLLVPQISEYCAIVLAHKFRRFNCDIEVGLSDEVHPSRSGENNPKGLIKKENLRQNLSETYKAQEQGPSRKEVLVSTTSNLEGHEITKYMGVETSFAIVNEEELARLQFVQKTLREESNLEQYETEDNVNSERAFHDYKNSFDQIFVELMDQLKSRAIKKRANALIGLNYQISSLPLEKSAGGSMSYQLICSATLALVRALK